MTEVSAADVYADIAETIERLFGLRIESAAEIHRGWLNLKWKLETDRGPIFAKQYHPDRYHQYTVADITTALAAQSGLHDRGFPCPYVYSSGGRHMLSTSKGERFTVQGFCSGELADAGKVNVPQMRHLGELTGQMHRMLGEELDVNAELRWMPPGREKMLADWASHWQAERETGREHVLEALELRRKIIDMVDWEWFAGCRTGWMHWDLWVDNILFYPDQVSAILDFDRLKFAYPELDVARAVMSCCLDGERFHMEKAVAFLEGYRECAYFDRGDLLRSLRLLWVLESNWWLTPELDDFSAPPARFAEENIWISRSWNELEDMFGGL